MYYKNIFLSLLIFFSHILRKFARLFFPYLLLQRKRKINNENSIIYYVQLYHFQKKNQTIEQQKYVTSYTNNTISYVHKTLVLYTFAYKSAISGPLNRLIAFLFWFGYNTNSIISSSNNSFCTRRKQIKRKQSKQPPRSPKRNTNTTEFWGGAYARCHCAWGRIQSTKRPCPEASGVDPRSMKPAWPCLCCSWWKKSTWIVDIKKGHTCGPRWKFSLRFLFVLWFISSRSRGLGVYWRENIEKMR